MVPASRGVRARSIDVHRTFVGLRLSSKEVFDLDPTWDDLKQCLASYTLAQILDLAGRVSAVLATGPAGDPEIQRNLVFAIFGPAATRVWTAVETSRDQWAREGELRPTVAIFDELQLVNLVKIAFLLLPLTSDLGTKSSPEGFGRGLLMLNALVEKDPSSLSVPDLSTDAGWRQGLYHLFVNGIFHHGELDLHVLARCYDLYLSDKPHLAECGAYVDLPALVRSTTGLEPDGFWAVLFALVGHTITLARTPATGGPMDGRRRDIWEQYCSGMRGQEQARGSGGRDRELWHYFAHPQHVLGERRLRGRRDRQPWHARRRPQHHHPKHRGHRGRRYL